MTRDRIKPRDYFDNFIQEENERINNFSKKLNAGAVKEDRIATIERKIESILFGILIARYSRGDSPDEFKTLFKTVIQNMSLHWNPEGEYIQMLWAFSIAEIIDIEEEDFNKLTAIIKKYKIKDYLINYFICKRENIPFKPEDYAMTFETPYSDLKEVIGSSNEKALKILKEYLEKSWYKGHRDCGWYDSHKSKHNTYFGYWSFESGAIVKTMGLDDSELKDVPYYPYDMVHWK